MFMFLLIATAQAADTAVVEAPSTASTIRDILLSLASFLVSVGIPVGLAYWREHSKIMQDAAMNASITASAERFGARLNDQLAAAGMHVSSVSVGDPVVASWGRKMMQAYPDFSDKLGLTPEVASSVVLGEATKQAQQAPPAAPIVPLAGGPVVVHSVGDPPRPGGGGIIKP